MPTILKDTNGGTGFQSVEEINQNLNVNQCGYCETTSNYTLNTSDSVPNSLGLYDGKIEVKSFIHPISSGGTGASTKREAIENLLFGSLCISLLLIPKNIITAMLNIK